MNIGAKIHPKTIKAKMAIHSKCPTTNPLDAPEPASPIICSLEIFVINREAPIINQLILLPARKYCAVPSSLFFDEINPTTKTMIR